MQKADEIAAYHEAGHALMGYRYHQWARDGVRIYRDGSGVCTIRNDQYILGELPTAKKHGDQDLIKMIWRNLEKAVNIFLAGPLAEVRFLNRRVSGLLVGADDHKTVKRYLEDAYPDDKRGAEFFWFLCQEHTRRVLTRPAAWNAITEMAAALIRRHEISDDGVQEICRKNRVHRESM